MKYLLPILLHFILSSCAGDDFEVSNEQYDTLLKPTVYPLKADSVYVLNLMTGQPIPPVITTNADTVKPGLPYALVGKHVILSAFTAEQRTKVTELFIENGFQNLAVQSVDKPKSWKITWDKPKAVDKNSHFTNYVLTNSQGKQVQTNVPLKLTGQKSSWKQLRPTSSSPMLLITNSSANLQLLDVDQGLHSSYILCIMEDSENNIWFGSYGGGVVRYNGTSFTLFNTGTGLSRDIVRVMLEDSKGNIWFGTTGGGLCKFDGTSFEIFSEPQGMPSDAINDIFEDSQNNLWFGTIRGVTKYDGTFFTHYSVKEGLINESVISIAEDTDGNMWFGTNQGINLLSNGQWFQLNGLPPADEQIVLSILSAQDSSVWFTLAGLGMYQFKNDSIREFTESNGLASAYIWSMIEDKRGDLWCGTSANGVIVYDGNSFKTFGEQEGIPNTEMRSICEDSRGNLWFGTYGNGVIKYNRNSFNHFDQDDGLTNSIARSIIEDKNGNLWFGTSGGGVCKFDGNRFSYLEDDNELSTSTVKSLYETKDGTLWIGTNGIGLFSYDGEYLAHYTTAQGLISDKILTIYEDSDSNLWVGTYGEGVCKFERNAAGQLLAYTLYSEEQGLSHNIAVAIYEDTEKNIWIATDGGGLNKLENGYLTNINEANGLSNRNPITIMQDQFGNYWSGTYDGGINIFDDHHILHLSESNGLVNNMVWSIKEIRDTNKSVFWVTTERGINLIELHCGESGSTAVADYRFKIHEFTKQDGLLGIDYYANSVCIDAKNRIWWGSGKGVEMLDLNLFQISDLTPEPKLNFIEINEQFVDFRNASDSNSEFHFEDVLKFANYPEKLVLPYDQNHLTFHYSAIDWSAPHKISYQFRLVGLNENWSTLSSKNEADFRSLPYGDYKFEVRSIGESQKWSSTFSYPFTILPPWWHTWWFRLCVFMLVVVILFALYRLRTATLRARQKQLEKTVEDRTEELKKEKELVEEKHKEITDSINYAERIQRSFLATKDLLDQNLNDYFVFFQPKDVVSGDFYWATKLENGNFVLVTADSTGHGVPGAIMSIANIACLKESVTKGFHEPDQILNETRRLVIDYLKNDGSAEGGKDGMDASLISFDFKNKKLKYASANNPIWVARLNAETKNYSMIECPADKMPVGKHDKQNTPFSGHEINLQKGDIVYTLTDGFPDQFGGEKGKKFMHKQLKELLCSIADQPLAAQQEKLKKVFFDWKGGLEQVDDVCVIGVRV
jgi:ligand-binding sensor domain-containing protein/serine phosphatase RsbU (regulator of sigma subunit)